MCLEGTSNLVKDRDRRTSRRPTLEDAAGTWRDETLVGRWYTAAYGNDRTGRVSVAGLNQSVRSFYEYRLAVPDPAGGEC